jgi:predicted enzyme related to lactoylglutathione lyase
MPSPTRILGAPCWIDLYSSDTRKATAFYGQLFGWTAEPADPRFGGYFTFTKEGKHVAGCMLNDGSGGMADAWTVYLETDDIDTVGAKAPANGGRVELPPMQVHENGSMAIVVDPGGARIGVWQPDQVHGFEIVGEPGAPAWFELQTGAYEDSVSFYRTVFGWNTKVEGDTNEFRYTTLVDGDAQRAGIMDATSYLKKGESASWSVYFDVDDVDRALEQLVDLGGTITEPAMDTPYGRLARAADVTGTPFKLVGHS